MLKRSLRLVFRNLARETAYSSINIVGLSIGIACCIILGLYLRSELSYDQHFENHDRIFRISSELSAEDLSSSFARTAPALGPMIIDESAGIEAYVRFFQPTTTNTLYSLFRYSDKVLNWDNVLLADDNVFDVFSHDIIYGDPQTAMATTNGIAISESFSNFYFGLENPLGEVLEGGTADYVVSLVFADLPDNTHLKYDALIPYARLGVERLNPAYSDATRENLWYRRSDFTYLLMQEGFQPDEFPATAARFFDEYMASLPERFGTTLRFFLEPLDGIHLDSSTQGDAPGGNRFYVLALLGVACFVLGVACINYMNLSTARFAGRRKEVAIHKILGARRHQLVLQLLLESLCIVFIALLLGLTLVELVLRGTSLNVLLEKSFSLQDLNNFGAILTLILGAMAVGLISGAYPAWLVSKPISTNDTNARSSRMRQGMMLMQFLVSICAISSTFLMYTQMTYVQEKSLGYEKENKITLRINGVESILKSPVFINELKQHSNILNASVSRNHFGRAMSVEQAEFENNGGEFETHVYSWFYVDEEFVDTMGINLLQGRNFNPELSNERNHAILVNETLVEQMGWDEPIGKRMRYDIADEPSYVVGVLEDFHFQSLQQAVEPIIFWLPNLDYLESLSEAAGIRQSRILTINISQQGIPETIAYIREQWQLFAPQQPFDFEFLDASLNALYDSDIRQMKLLGLFAGLCIFISCLGLFGLSAITMQQRRKEVGVRKVLGATVMQIVLLFFKNIIPLVILATLAGSIFSYLAINEWLQSFAYRAAINPLTFLLTAVIVFVVAFITMATQSLKTAQSNPVESLRYE